MPINGLKILAILFLITLSACAPHQYVPGAYMTPNKRVEGIIVGGVAGGVLGATSQFAAGGAAVGAGTGLGITHLYSREGLIANLRSHGANVIVMGDKVRIVLSSDALFKFDTPTLKPSSYPTMDYTAALLKEYGRTPIWVTGYTDDVGSYKRNKDFSLEQARSVVTYLWVHGIEFQHLFAVGMGSEYPVATNKTVMGSSWNRRIEITLTTPCKMPGDPSCLPWLSGHGWTERF